MTLDPVAAVGATTTDYAPFPFDVLPEPVRQFVVEAAAAIGCDTALVALPTLAAMAGVIGNSRVICLKPGWCEPSVLWAVTIAESGQQKSPAHDAPFRPLYLSEQAALREHAEAMERFERDMALFDADYRAWKSKGRKSGEEPPEKPQPPICARTLISDATLEAVAVISADNPRGLLLHRDELAGWLRSFDAYKKGQGGDVQHWLSMHSARPVIVDRKTGDRKTIYVPRAAVSIYGTIQPQTLHRTLGSEHRENGMLARLLVAYPPPRRKRWTEAKVSERIEAALSDLYDRLRALDLDLGEHDQLRPRVLHLSPDGKARWVEFYNEHADTQADLTGNAASMWSKLEAGAARFALIFHLIRSESGDRTVKRHDEIDGASVEAGCALARWFGAEASRVYGLLSETDEERDGRELSDWITRRGGKVTTRDVQQSYRPYKGDTEGAELALNRIAKAGRGHWSETFTSDQGGRPTRLFCLSNVSETLIKHDERDGFGDNNGHCDVNVLFAQAAEEDGA